MSEHSPLSSLVLVSQHIAAQIASANVNGIAGIDTSGWDGCQFEFNIGAMASSATFDARIVSSPNANMSGGVNVTNAALTQVPNTANTGLFIIDLFRPTQRYLLAATQPATANVTYSCTATLYRRTGVLPPTQVAIQQVTVVQN